MNPGFEVYIAPIDKPGKQRVSSGEGSQPDWRPDGKELYFLSHGSLMAAEVKHEGESVTFGKARPASHIVNITAPEAKRGLRYFAGRQEISVSCQSVDATKRSVTVMIGWLDMVKRVGYRGKE